MVFESGAAFAAAKREIAQRLRRICDYCDEDEFARLVERMARIEVKYRMRDVLGLFFQYELPRLRG
jgi:hypothetical protein